MGKNSCGDETSMEIECSAEKMCKYLIECGDYINASWFVEKFGLWGQDEEDVASIRYGSKL